MKKFATTIVAAAMTAGIALSANAASAAAVTGNLPTVQQSQEADKSVQQVGYYYRYQCYWVRYGYRTFYRCFYRYYYY